MKYKVIEIPGGTTSWEDNPEVTVVRHELRGPDLRIKYHAAPTQSTDTDKTYTFGVLNFYYLYEYRWVCSDHTYSHFPEGDNDGWAEEPLIEIEDSKWIEAMRARSVRLRNEAAHPGKLTQSQITHYRLRISEYGIFDILAHSFSSEQVVEVIDAPRTEEDILAAIRNFKKNLIMGQDFRCIVGHSLKPEDLPDLPARVEAFTTRNEPDLRLAGLRSGQAAGIYKWKWGWDKDYDPPFDEWLTGGNISLYYQYGGIFIHIGRHSLQFGCWRRWIDFLTDAQQREALRRVCRDLAKTFGSDRVFYKPDSSSLAAERASDLAFEGATMDEIEVSLERNMGRPVPLVGSEPFNTQDRTICYKEYLE